MTSIHSTRTIHTLWLAEHFCLRSLSVYLSWKFFHEWSTQINFYRGLSNLAHLERTKRIRKTKQNIQMLCVVNVDNFWTNIWSIPDTVKICIILDGNKNSSIHWKVLPPDRHFAFFQDSTPIWPIHNIHLKKRKVYWIFFICMHFKCQN